ncbi:GntR family transcriptional regulator [Acidisoma cellulosilyticum]|nr:GntR family transcriptional regulator [Acidisoma cellulosilyticum]
MSFALDRSLPVLLGVQLRGRIKYGIACGELRPGERLPSVRELATQIGIAPMTVATVYRELKEVELLEGRGGSGTFVAWSGAEDKARRSGLQQLRARIDALLSDAEALGLDRPDILALVQTRLQARPSDGLRLVFVGVFATATRDYAAAVEARLPPGDRVTSVTVEALRCDPGLRLKAAGADLVLTIPDRRPEVAALLGPQAPALVAIGFLPAEHVRAALAALDPFARVAVVSLFPEWLVMMKAGVARFAPHVSQVATTVLDAPELGAVLASADVTVYATGAEAVLERLPEGFPSLEYRHSPDPGDIERSVLPMLHALRTKTAITVPQEVLCG